jgi:alanine-alpha-ketoisovalerate/valine-pyruvate aminotransferase
MHYPPDVCMSVTKPGLPKGIPGQRDSIAISDQRTIKAVYKFQ